MPDDDTFRLKQAVFKKWSSVVLDGTVFTYMKIQVTQDVMLRVPDGH